MFPKVTIDLLSPVKGVEREQRLPEADRGCPGHGKLEAQPRGGLTRKLWAR